MKVTRFIVLVVCLIACGATLAADNAGMWGAVGSGDGGTSFGIGGRYARFGAQFGGVLTSEVNTSDYNDEAIPHDDYTVVGWKRKENRLGGDLLVFFDVSNKIAVFGGVGYYWQDEVLLVQSNVTGWLWKEAERTDSKGAATIGLTATLSPKMFLMAQYNSVIGPNVGLGFRF